MIEQPSLFHGQPMRIWQTDHLKIGVLTEAGPRIVWLSLADSEETAPSRCFKPYRNMGT